MRPAIRSLPQKLQLRPTYSKVFFYRYRNNHRNIETCLPSSIPQKSRSSAFVPSEEKSQPLLLWLPRSVHWVFHPRKLVTTLPKPLKNGRVSRSLSDLPSRIVKLRSTLYPLPQL